MVILEVYLYEPVNVTHSTYILSLWIIYGTDTIRPIISILQPCAMEHFETPVTITKSINITRLIRDNTIDQIYIL